MPVSNPTIVDALIEPKEGSSVILVMFEERDWTELNTQFRELEAKLNCYLDFVMSGQLNEQPGCAGKSVHFQLILQFDPPPAAKPVLDAIRKHCASQGVTFIVTVSPVTSATGLVAGSSFDTRTRE